MSDFNAGIIEEFRANDGQLGGQFAGAPMLLLHSLGAKSGEPRIHPLMYLRDGDRYLIFASKAGADTNPAWFHNLRAHPDTQIEVEDRTVDVHATELVGEERDTWFAEQARRYSGFADYEAKTTRKIPVVALVPAA